MKIRHLIASSALLFVFLVSPVQTSAQTIVTEDNYRTILVELIKALQQQILVLQAELDSQLEREARLEVIPGSFIDSVSKVATYKINNLADVSRIQNREHREYFLRVFELFPDEYDEKLKRLEVFDGEDSEFDAFVETLPPLHDDWRYAANNEIIEDQDSDGNTELIVHELAHVISYEEILGVPKPMQANCEEYFEIHGCPTENSYLGQFVNTFWSDSDLERVEQSAYSLDESYAYYEKHEDEFVSDYAASAPEEDFADSFMFFVLEDSSEFGKIAQKKVDWFGRYEELKMIREEILDNK